MENDEKKWIVIEESGDRIAITRDTVLLVGLNSKGDLWYSRTGTGSLTVITSEHAPEGIAHIISPATDDPEALKRIEANVVAAVGDKLTASIPLNL